MTYPPNSELVARAWVGTAAGLTTSRVALMLPQDTSTWAADGFVTLGGGGAGAVVGGVPDRYTQLRNPVISAHCWAINPASAKPPWGKAARLAELIREATNDEATIRRTLTLPAGYGPARVNEAYALSEPRRVPGDQGMLAHFQFDLQLHWIAL